MAVISNFGVPADNGEIKTLMPKLQYRFRVTFVGLGANPGTPEVTQNVINVGRPSMTHEEVVVDSYNSKIYLAGKHTWEPITIVLRDDLESGVIKAFGAQLNKQLDHEMQSAANAGAGYKFSVKIETLDGNNTNPTVFDTWDLAGCYLSGVQYGELNYGTSDMVQVTATLRYDNAAHLIGGENDALSGGQVTGGTSPVLASGPN